MATLCAAALVAVSAGCGALLDSTTKPAGPTVPPGPAFNHAAHIEKGLECVDCHEGTEEQDKAGMPDPEFCMECHEDMDAEKPAAKRVSAFLTGPGGAPAWKGVTKQSAELRFSHAKHLAKDVKCTDCHRGIEESKAVSTALRQTMDDCLKCHGEKNAPTTCATCHTEIGSEGWMPPNHDRMWETLHGQIVRRGSPRNRLEDCAMCHEQSDCLTCHATEKPRDHTNAWRIGGGHGLAAAMDRERCSTCHQPDGCIRCHATVEPRSHRASWGAPRDRHCVSCHLPLRRNSPEGCGECHDGTPSHGLAPAKPDWHTPDMQCALCHTPLKHADNGQNCNICHR